MPTLKSSLLAAIVAVLAWSTAAPAQTTRPIVLGYVPTWRDRVADPKDFNFDIYTHLCRAFLRPQADGSLQTEDNYFNPEFEQAAHAHGVKLLMSVGGEAKSPDRWLSLASDPTRVQTFLNSLDVLFRDHQYDGVDIDWEPPPRSAAEGQQYLALLQAVRKRFPDKLLTVALSPKNYAVKYLPLRDVLDTIDYFNAMAYDFSGPWTGNASFGTNLYGDPAAHTEISTSEAITNLIDKHDVPPGKLIVGMSFWAYRFRVDHLGDHFTKNGKGLADNIEYARVVDLMSTGRYALRRDSVADASYLVRNDGGCVITFEDPQAAKDTTAFAMSSGCAGVMMWNAGADLDAGRTPLLDGIAAQLGRPTTQSSAALQRETEQLNHGPLPSTMPADIAALNDRLRLARGLADDERWMAAAPATQPTTMPSAAATPIQP